MNDNRLGVQDSHVFFPSARVSVGVGDGGQSRSEPRSGHAIELVAVQATGTQTAWYDVLGTPPPFVFGNTTFAVPQQIKQDVDLGYADLSYRWRKFFDEGPLGMELFGGVGHTSLGLTLSSPTQRASEHYSTNGLQGGAGLIWRVRPGTSLHGRMSQFFSTSHAGIENRGRLELYVSQVMSENMSLRAGYVSSGVTGSGYTYPMPFWISLSGPSLELGWDF